MVPKFDNSYLRFGGVFLILIAVIGLAVIFTGSSDKTTKQATDCGHYRNDRTLKINGAEFKTEAPNNQAEFTKGLAGRPCILPDEAMIFPFKAPAQYAFWMKGMKFPIDVLWINANHQVVAAFVNLQPSSYPKKFENPATRPAQYVLELKANRSKDLRIGLGTIVQF